MVIDEDLIFLRWSGLVWSGLVWSGLVWSGLVDFPSLEQGRISRTPWAQTLTMTDRLQQSFFLARPHLEASLWDGLIRKPPHLQNFPFVQPPLVQHPFSLFFVEPHLCSTFFFYTTPVFFKSQF